MYTVNLVIRNICFKCVFKCSWDALKNTSQSCELKFDNLSGAEIPFSMSLGRCILGTCWGSSRALKVHMTQDQFNYTLNIQMYKWILLSICFWQGRQKHSVYYLHPLEFSKNISETPHNHTWPHVQSISWKTKSKRSAHTLTVRVTTSLFVSDLWLKSCYCESIHNSRLEEEFLWS